MIKKYLYIDIVLVWMRYFLTVRLNTVISNYLIPLGLTIVMFINLNQSEVNPEFLSNFVLGSITISTLIIGFSYSMIVSLISSESENIKKLKETNIKNRTISKYEALVYKFYFVIINLVVVVIFALFLLLLSTFNLLLLSIILYFIIISFAVLLEGLTNLVSVFRK